MVNTVRANRVELDYVAGGTAASPRINWNLPLSYDLTAYRGAAIRVRIPVSVGSAGAHVVSSWNIVDVSWWLSAIHCRHRRLLRHSF